MLPCWMNHEVEQQYASLSFLHTNFCGNGDQVGNLVISYPSEEQNTS